MKLTITINLDNSAFDSEGEGDPETINRAPEAVRILEKLADYYREAGIYQAEGGRSKPILDINGNKVGASKITI